MEESVSDNEDLMVNLEVVKYSLCTQKKGEERTGEAVFPRWKKAVFW